MSDILGAGATGIAVLNYLQTKKKYRRDLKLQKLLMKREDTAAQRRVEDLKAAGLSPVLAAGSAAGSGGIVSTTAPQLDPNVVANMMQPSHTQSVIDQQQAQIALTQAQESLVNLQKEKIKPEIDQLKALKKKADSDTYLNYKAAKLREAETQLKGLDYSKSKYDYIMSKDAGMSTSPQGFGKSLLDITGTISKILGTHPNQQLNNQTQSAISGITGVSGDW